LKPENFAGARDMDTAIFDVRIHKARVMCDASLFVCVCRLARQRRDERVETRAR
jgi:hypothetical protein